jgi:transcriptional regulator with XRE-family HTH domain
MVNILTDAQPRVKRVTQTRLDGLAFPLVMTNPRLGARLTQERIKAGYHSQKELADALGVSRGAVGNWEVGERPSMAHAEALAWRLGVDRAEMLSRYGYPIGGGSGSEVELSPAFQQAISEAVSEALRAQVPAIVAALAALRETPPPPEGGDGVGPEPPAPQHGG